MEWENDLCVNTLFVSRTSFPLTSLADIIFCPCNQHGQPRCNQRTHHLFSNIHRLRSQISPGQVLMTRKDHNEVRIDIYVFLLICIFVYVYLHIYIYIYLHSVCIYIYIYIYIDRERLFFKTIFMMCSSFH